MDWRVEKGEERATRSRKTRRKQTKQHTVYYYIIIMMQTERHAEDLGKRRIMQQRQPVGRQKQKAIGRKLRREEKAIEILTNRKKKGTGKCLLDDSRCPHRSAPGVEMEAQLANQRELGGS